MTPLDVLTAEGAQVVTRAELWSDGEQVDAELQVIDGDVTYDVSARVARSCTAELLGSIPADGRSGLAPVGNELHLFRGARDYTGEVHLQPLGRYAFDGSSVERSSRSVKLSGYSYEALASDARWEQPYVIPAGTDLGTAIAQAVESRLPAGVWQEPSLPTTTATVPQTVWGDEVDNDPWADVASLAVADGLELLFDRTGRLSAFETPDPDEQDVRFDFTAGTSPLYLTGARQLTGRPYNVVVARGEAADGTAPVGATAEDDDPSSPSYVGRYRRPYFLTSSYITDASQALRAARAELRRQAGLAEVVTMEVVPHPELDVWQVIRAQDPELGVEARYVIDKVQLPLRPGTATVTTRRRRL